MTTERDEVVLVANDLAKHYPVSQGFLKPKALARALDGVSFEVKAGRTLAVVGESGCGKSTLARQITMIEAPTTGHLVLAGVDVANADAATRKRLRREVQMVFQNPFASLNPRKKIGHALEEPLAINTELGQAERSERARAMMARVGLRPEHHARYPHMFSGGQRQRVAIARALATEPDFIVADEPVSALDVSVQAQIIALMAELRSAFGLALLFISHDLHVVRHLCERVVVMYLGRVVEEGPAAEVFHAPAHPYTRALIAATPSITARTQLRTAVLSGELPSPASPPSGCVFRTRCPHAIAACAETVPALREIGTGRRVACLRDDVVAQRG